MTPKGNRKQNENIKGQDLPDGGPAQKILPNRFYFRSIYIRVDVCVVVRCVAPDVAHTLLLLLNTV
jgi:hypothetical protein